MIIISQDKTEIINFNNVESIWICSDEEGIFTIEATADTNTSLGEYRTEERAKEVLEEIVNTFSIRGVQNTSYEYADIAVKIRQYAKYEMPKK